MNRRRRDSRRAAINDRLRPTPEPTLTVGSYGSTFTWDRERGFCVNGEPYNPDDDGVHQPVVVSSIEEFEEQYGPVADNIEAGMDC